MPGDAAGRADACAQQGADEQLRDTCKQQQDEQGAVSNRVGMHAPMRVRELGQPEGARGRQTWGSSQRKGCWSVAFSVDPF